MYFDPCGSSPIITILTSKRLGRPSLRGDGVCLLRGRSSSKGGNPQNDYQRKERRTYPCKDCSQAPLLTSGSSCTMRPSQGIWKWNGHLCTRPEYLGVCMQFLHLRRNTQLGVLKKDVCSTQSKQQEDPHFRTRPGQLYRRGNTKYWS